MCADKKSREIFRKSLKQTDEIVILIQINLVLIRWFKKTKYLTQIMANRKKLYTIYIQAILTFIAHLIIVKFALW